MGTEQRAFSYLCHIMNPLLIRLTPSPGIIPQVFSNRRFLSKLLQRRMPKGTTFEEAEDGKAAVEAVTKAGPGYYSVISMDKEMPVMVSKPYYHVLCAYVLL